MDTALTPSRASFRRRSFSQLSTDGPLKDVSNLCADEDDFCIVNCDKSADELTIWEKERGFQSIVFQLKLTDMLAQKMERLQWEQLKANIDFSVDPGPVKCDFRFPNPEVGILAEEAAYSHPPLVANDEDAFDQPCSSRSLQVAVNNDAVEDSDSNSDPFLTDHESKPNGDSANENSENVVNALLRHYEERANQAVSTNELVSMVAVSDVHQNPLPASLHNPVPEDEVFTVDGKRIRLRGSAIWAPPKRKFIFDLSEIKDPKAQLVLQNNRCAGCGIVFTKLYARRARLCNYYNKLFCQCCFLGEKARIPARILRQWNFKEYPVSDFAYRFLMEYEDHPVYSIKAINDDLYKTIRKLGRARILRLKASHMWQYIQRCRTAERTLTTFGNLRTMFASIPSRFLKLELVDDYSILDLDAVENGNMADMLVPIVSCGKLHIEGCADCAQLSFFCQICADSKDWLFSFQLERVHRCDGCGALSHLKCYNHKKRETNWQCSRCVRMRRKYNCRRGSRPNSTNYDSD